MLGGAQVRQTEGRRAAPRQLRHHPRPVGRRAPGGVPREHVVAGRRQPIAQAGGGPEAWFERGAPRLLDAPPPPGRRGAERGQRRPPGRAAARPATG